MIISLSIIGWRQRRSIWIYWWKYFAFWLREGQGEMPYLENQRFSNYSLDHWINLILKFFLMWGLTSQLVLRGSSFKIYTQSYNAQQFQLEFKLTNFSQDSCSIEEFYFDFSKVWTKNTDIIYASVSPDSFEAVQANCKLNLNTSDPVLWIANLFQH